VTPDPLRKVVNRPRALLRALSGFGLFGLLFAAGAASALAHAPVYFQPALIGGLVLLVWSLDDARRSRRPLRAGFARAWAFAAGYFLAGTHWVASAFLVSAEDHAWLIWAPLTLLPGGLALFWGVAGAAYARLAGSGPERIAVFAGLFVCLEFVRSVILSGFPWNLPGHVFEAGGAISQAASLIGALGLSALALYAFASPAALRGAGGPVARAYPIVASVLVLAGFWLWGDHRLNGSDVQETGVTVRVVQLDRPQAELRPSQASEILDEYLALTLTEGLDAVDLVIWPEGSVPAFLQNEPRLLERLHAALPLGTRLVAGAPHIVWSPINQPEAVYNSLHALRIGEEHIIVEDRYDKVKLVPFGEANTIAALTRPFGLETLSQYGVGFDAGANARTLSLGAAPPFAPLICYEVVYPRFSPRGSDRPAWLLNISNDSWFGDSAGPAQLLNQARYRSIEEGLPLVRSATAGVSGIIDPYGRVGHIAGVEESQVLDLVLLASLDKPFYGHYGDGPWVIAFAFLAGIALIRPVLARQKAQLARKPGVVKD